MEDWETRHLRSRRKEKWDVGAKKEREKKEGEKAEKLAGFFGTIYEFLSDFKSFEDNSSSSAPSPIPYVVIDNDDEDVDTSFVAFPSSFVPSSVPYFVADFLLYVRSESIESE